jgi:DNA-binding GntR family transcriptional regulator
MPKRSRAHVEQLAEAVASPSSHGAEFNAATVTSVLHHALRTDIISLTLRPGAQLRIRDLRTRYAAGATPLREALCTLAGEGLVEAEPQHGFRVAPATRDDLCSLALLRGEIEPIALRLAMERDDAAWRQGVTESYRNFESVRSKVGDQRPIDREWENRHRAFHIALIAGCGQPQILSMMVRWYDLCDRYRRLASDNIGATAGTNADHEAMVESVMSRRIDEAVAILRRHIDDTTRRHLAYFETSGEA